MIPALAMIIAFYVIFRCITLTLDALNRLAPNTGVKALSLAIVILGAVVVIFIAVANNAAIQDAATEMPSF